MAIYTHAALFALSPFPSDKCHRCLVKGQTKMAQHQADRDVGREKDAAQRVGDAGTTRNDAKSRDVRLTGLGQALQPGSNGANPLYPKPKSRRTKIC